MQNLKPFLLGSYSRKRKGVIKMAKKETKNIDRRMFKKEGEELQQYLHFRKRGSIVRNKKGKGSYDRKKCRKFDENS
jgi:stalled ribosome alternative rescue factor ArfA